MNPTAGTAGLSPAAMSERTGVSIDTLRYYEREGLLENGSIRGATPAQPSVARTLTRQRWPGPARDARSHHCDAAAGEGRLAGGVEDGEAAHAVGDRHRRRRATVERDDERTPEAADVAVDGGHRLALAG